MIEINFKFGTECPICGEELAIIDNYNYVTMICPKCHSTVFEEFNHKIHVIKNGIMKDGYNASLDIFYKQLLAHSMYANNLSPSEYKKYWSEIKLIGIVGNEDILADGIYEYFVDKIKDFKMKQPCIYFKGYEKYLELSKPESEKFKNTYLKRK